MCSLRIYVLNFTLFFALGGVSNPTPTHLRVPNFTSARCGSVGYLDECRCVNYQNVPSLSIKLRLLNRFHIRFLKNDRMRLVVLLLSHFLQLLWYRSRADHLHWTGSNVLKRHLLHWISSADWIDHLANTEGGVSNRPGGLILICPHGPVVLKVPECNFGPSPPLTWRPDFCLRGRQIAPTTFIYVAFILHLFCEARPQLGRSSLLVLNLLSISLQFN